MLQKARKAGLCKIVKSLLFHASGGGAALYNAIRNWQKRHNGGLTRVSALTDSKGYYAILGVSEKATQLEIKKAYRRMARKYHPDRNGTAHAEDMIKRINAAYEVLSGW